VKLITGTSQRLLQEIRSGAADLGFITLPVNEPELVTVPAMEEEMLLVAHPSHPLAKKHRIVPQDLVQQPFVLFEAVSNSRRVVDGFFAKEGIEPRIVMETENVEIIKALVRSEMGITIIPYQSVAREVRSGQLFCARISGTHLVRHTGWVYQRSNRIPRMLEEMFKAYERVAAAPEFESRQGRRESKDKRYGMIDEPSAMDKAILQRSASALALEADSMVAQDVVRLAHDGLAPSWRCRRASARKTWCSSTC
jgi:DNA-binding transcriptional LysR family regulator